MTIKDARIAKNLSTREAAANAGFASPIVWNLIERARQLATEQEKAAIIALLGPVEFPTEADIEAQRIEDEARMGKYLEARKLITEHSEGKRSVSGQIICPKCGANLHYSIASNGHCHARCSTPGCLAWME